MLHCVDRLLGLQNLPVHSVMWFLHSPCIGMCGVVDFVKCSCMRLSTCVPSIAPPDAVTELTHFNPLIAWRYLGNASSHHSGCLSAAEHSTCLHLPHLYLQQVQPYLLMHGSHLHQLVKPGQKQTLQSEDNMQASCAVLVKGRLPHRCRRSQCCIQFLYGLQRVRLPVQS